jgi:hypothetical protein
LIHHFIDKDTKFNSQVTGRHFTIKIQFATHRQTHKIQFANPEGLHAGGRTLAAQPPLFAPAAPRLGGSRVGGSSHELPRAGVPTRSRVGNMASYVISSSLILVIHDNMINGTNHIDKHVFVDTSRFEGCKNTTCQIEKIVYFSRAKTVK